MALSTYSLFFYGHTVTTENKSLDFDEGGSELQATLTPGEYTFTEFLSEIKRAMEAVGALTYTVSASRTTRYMTISAASNFTLRVASGSRHGTTAYTLMGFTGSNRTGANTYTSSAGTGSEYEPQYKLQDYVAPEDNLDAVDEKINEAASGVIELVKFGDRQFMECAFHWVTNKSPTGSTLIKLNTSAVANLRSFMTYLCTKAPIEFMPDIGSRATFYKLQLESTQANKAGTGFKLKEKVDKKLPGYFESGHLVFRVID
jgi:hypothetical protein